VFVRLVAPALVALLASLIAVALTAFVSVPLALVLAALLFALGVLVPAWTRRAGSRAAVEGARAEAAYGSDALDLLRDLTDHLSGDGGHRALGTLDSHLARREDMERVAARLSSVTTFLQEAVPALGVVAALFLVGQDVARGGKDPLLLAAAALGMLGAFEAVGVLGAAWAASAGIRAAIGRVQALDDERPAVIDPTRPLPPPAGAALRFAGVTLTYPNSNHPALMTFDLCLREGEKVALTGSSGAGKSTVLALALRTRDPDAGCVTVGGTDLRDLALDDVRARFAWAAQTPQLLGGTIAGNLRLARQEVSDEELEKVLHDLELGELLGTVGLNGWIGESGERLSAGERARLGIARALLSPAPVLLLDEPTAHLDPPLAAHLLNLLANQQRAVLLVTHTPAALDERWRVVTLHPPK
jgi:ABC-type transport system involved in cytochrome bd biosynthesis fused ATPase/permease subunit